MLAERDSSTSTYLPCHIFKPYAEVNGFTIQMTPGFDDAVSEGRNYEHDKVAVHKTRLEKLYRVSYAWKLVLEKWLIRNPGQEPIKKVLFPLCQAQLESSGLTKVKLDKLEKLIFFIEIIGKYQRLADIVYNDYVNNGLKSQWSMTKVCTWFVFCISPL